MKGYQFKKIAAAGSWDHFHQGHRHFLRTAFVKANTVLIGVTADKMIGGKSYKGSLEKLEERQKNIINFLKLEGLTDRAESVVINDIYGTALKDKKIEALLVTRETTAGGMMINNKRKKLGLRLLQLIKVKMEKAQDGKAISSRRIRKGEIDRKGTVYLSELKTVMMPQAIRAKLKRPFGELITENEALSRLKEDPVITLACVGDVVTKLLMADLQKADIYIVDLQVERKRRYENIFELGFAKKTYSLRATNKAGTISKGLIARIKQMYAQIEKGEKAPVLVVKGEEDLAVLPVILAAPLQSVVLYGQPKQGVVWVPVTEEKKAQAYELLKRFEHV